ncbi:MAG: outer membrane lipoprotein-sorting protein [Pseudomonadota bacterium]
MTNSRPRPWAGVALGLILSVTTSLCVANPATDLAQRVYDRPDGSIVLACGTMDLTEKGHPPRTRELFSYARDNDQNDFWSLLRFTGPQNIAGTALLSENLGSGAEKQWVYLPALGRSRRISSKRKGGRFVSSDLYYEDLQDRKPSEDTHRIIGNEPCAGVTKACTLLESIPVNKKDSVYSKRVSWIDESTLIAMRIDLYEKGRDKPSKRFETKKYKKIDGFWTIVDSVMTELKSGHQTRTRLYRVIYDPTFSDHWDIDTSGGALFSRKTLEDEEREEGYRYPLVAKYVPNVGKDGLLAAECEPDEQ